MSAAPTRPAAPADPAHAAAWLEDLLRRCGKLLLDCRAGAWRGEWEGEQYKDSRDLLAHEFLVNGLRCAYPQVPVVSEEDITGHQPGGDEYFIIDPIDGTASFAHGFPGWVTQAAFVRHGVPQLAGVYAPASDEYFSATRQGGARRNNKPLAVDKASRPFASLIDNYPTPAGIALEAMATFDIGTYVESGSLSLKICRVADGTADLFLKQMTPRDWDLAAPMLIIEEAGGILADRRGLPIRLGRNDLRHQGLIATTDAERLEQVRAWLASRE